MQFNCSKISAVSVQEGLSAIIPCLYEKEHEDDTKLWCRKDNLSECAAAVNSKQSQSAAGVAISDIKHGIFIVNMTNIRNANDYCCTAKPKTKPPQSKDCIEIKISKDGPMLSVLNPMISGYESGTASVLFKHRFPGSKRQFCQLAGECVGWDNNSASLNGMSVMLSDVPNGELKVTLSGLQRKNTGWYVCSMGGYQTPVHLSVTGIGPTPATEFPETSTNTTALKTGQDGMVVMLVLVCVAVLVLIVLCGAAVGLVQWRRGKREAPRQAAADTNSASADPEVIYADVMNKKKSPKSPAEPSDQVTYSTLRPHLASAGVDTNSKDLTYGSIVHKTRRKSRKAQLKVSAAEDLYSEVRVHHK
ncbi:uncharacterized protein LOC143114934 [Alosa pseudoharengus]|uniref:uncharacterized protein LOC143114934 n=1 Tax=Alosa pseudoharengus TaxID=34774 RepID=UPI003F8BEF9C